MELTPKAYPFWYAFFKSAFGTLFLKALCSMSFNASTGQAVALIEGKGIKSTPVYFDEDDMAGKTSVDIPKGKAQAVLIPPSVVSKRERDVWYLSGKSGAGKSYLSASLIDFYRKTGQRVYVLSPIKDAKFGKDAKYLKIDNLVGMSSSYDKDNARYQEAKIRFKYKKKELAENPDLLMKLELRLNELKPDPSKRGRMEMKLCPDKMEELFSDSVILFDDYQEGMTGGEIKLVEFFRDFYLTTGRHTRTSMILCHHISNDREKTKMIMTETSNIVLFSKSTTKSREYLLKTYYGFDKGQIAEVEKRMKAKDRWVCFDKDMGILMTPQRLWVH